MQNNQEWQELTPALLVYNSNISDGVYSSVVIATAGAYLTSNVFQKKIEVKD